MDSRRTSLEPSSGNWLSNCALPAALSSPPSRSSDGSARAAVSLPVANCVASSPRRARSRAKKSSADGEPTSLMSVCAMHQDCKYGRLDYTKRPPETYHPSRSRPEMGSGRPYRYRWLMARRKECDGEAWTRIIVVYFGGVVKSVVECWR